MVFELQFLDWLQTLQTPILNEIMKAVTHLGDAGALWIILAAVLLAFPKTRKLSTASFIRYTRRISPSCT